MLESLFNIAAGLTVFFIENLVFIILFSKFYGMIEFLGSSNVNEVIRVVLNSLFFLTKRFCTHQKQ